MLAFRKVVRFVAVFGALVGLVASNARSAGLDQKLQQEVDQIAASRFEHVGDDTIHTVGKGEQAIVPVQFDVNVVYAIVAVCGEGCDHVEITLFDPSQNLLHQSPEVSDVVIITGPPRQSGVHGIALSAPGCREATCQVGIALLKQSIEPPASVPEAQATPIAPHSGATPPGSTSRAQPNADPETLRIFSELVNLGVSMREAVRAKERATATIAAPVATTAGKAPGRPAGFKEPQASPKSPPMSHPVQAPTASRRNANPADCQSREQQYYAAARTAGSPGTIGPLLSMYQYLQCNCGHPPSPQLPPCPR